MSAAPVRLPKARDAVARSLAAARFGQAPLPERSTRSPELLVWLFSPAADIAIDRVRDAAVGIAPPDAHDLAFALFEATAGEGLGSFHQWTGLADRGGYLRMADLVLVWCRHAWPADAEWPDRLSAPPPPLQLPAGAP